MLRRTYQAAVAILFIALHGCGGTEEAVVSRFLTATRNNDLATLADISMVGFSRDVDSWRVIGVRGSRRELFTLSRLREKMIDAREARDLHSAEFEQFRNENVEELNRIINQGDNASDPPRAGQKELLSTWQRHQRVSKQRRALILQLRREVDFHREGARKSLLTWSPVDEFDGKEEVREVLVTVKFGEGGGKAFIIIMKRFDLVHTKDGTRPEARWIIMEIQEQSGA